MSINVAVYFWPRSVGYEDLKQQAKKPSLLPTKAPVRPVDGVDWDCCAKKGRGASNPFVSGDGFRCVADFVFDETTNAEIQPSLQTLQEEVVLIFVKGDKLHEWFDKWHGRIKPFVSKKGYMIVSHNSDDSPDSAMLTKFLTPESHLLHFFGQNIFPSFDHERVTAVPIGLENLRWGHQLPEIYKNVAPSSSDKRANALLVSFNPNTKERKEVVEVMKGKSWVKFALKGTPSQLKGPKEFVEELSKAAFVLSPPGNGFDCHRTWEILACGAIPVLRRGTLHESTIRGNVVWVNDWKDIESRAWLEEHTSLQNEENGKMEYYMNMFKVKGWKSSKTRKQCV